MHVVDLELDAHPCTNDVLCADLKIVCVWSSEPLSVLRSRWNLEQTSHMNVHARMQFSMTGMKH